MIINRFKKVAVGLASLAIGFAGFAQGYNQGALFSQPVPQVMSTTIATTTTNTFIVLTNRVKIVDVQLLSGANNNIVWFFNNNSLVNGGTNYVTSLYNSTSVYPTNYVTSFVGYNGWTNYYTNAGQWTFTVTNAAATNALSPMGVFASAANTIGNYPCDMLMERGVVITSQTNTQLILYYIPQ